VARKPTQSTFADVVGMVEAARRASARAINTLITATYWTIGRRIVEQEQHGHARADYGAALVDRLAVDLTARFGRGFGRRNLFQMRALYLAYREIPQAGLAPPEGRSGARKVQTPSALSLPMTTAIAGTTAPTFPLPWSHYVRLLSVRSVEARRFRRNPSGAIVHAATARVSVVIDDEAPASSWRHAWGPPGRHRA